jgi:tRNA-splicing ligase RtcB
MKRSDINQIDDNLWEIPQNAKPMMRVPARIYASSEMIDAALRDRSFEQLTNVATLPGIQSNAIVMPDVHEGYGFPIGAVAATDIDDGVISPGGIGYDINCGIRLIKTEFDLNSIKPHLARLSKEIYKEIPSGVGKSGFLRLKGEEYVKALKYGSSWAFEAGYAEDDDLLNTESNGRMEAADPRCVSKKAKDRGFDQLGTMGSGNHFVEINVVDKIFDESTATVFGLRKEQIVVQIHTGSRGLGHQVATDFVKSMIAASEKYKIDLPDRELACAPFSSPEGQEYFAAMCCAANYAWANRQVITASLRKAWRSYFGDSAGNLPLLYDVAHNIAKIEEYIIDGVKKKLVVHRKGATRAFPAGHPDLPEHYRAVGQPVLIPGSMGTASYVLAGNKGALENTFATSCHGSGRTMSRSAALKIVQGSELKAELNSRGIEIQTASLRGLAEEAPKAYKDVESVVNVVHNSDIARKVVRLKPLAVIKG